jgi:hypothetical protein
VLEAACRLVDGSCPTGHSADRLASLREGKSGEDLANDAVGGERC